MTIPRLTAARVRRATKKGKTSGWYDLCRAGYLPEEIHLYDEKAWPSSEVRYKIREFARERGLPIPANCAKKRERTVRSEAPPDHRAAFRACAMRTGLALTLTQPMLESLCAIACQVPRDRQLHFQALGSVQPDNFIATNAALRKRGLIDCDSKLTSLGVIVIDLLKEAAVFVVPDAALVEVKA